MLLRRYHNREGHPAGPSAGDTSDLGSLKVAELRALAESRGVDLGDARKKADIVAVLEAAGADAPDNPTADTEPSASEPGSDGGD